MKRKRDYIPKLEAIQDLFEGKKTTTNAKITFLVKVFFFTSKDGLMYLFIIQL